MDQEEVDAMARTRLQPTLDEISNKAEKQRAADEEARLDAELKKRKADNERMDTSANNGVPNWSPNPTGTDAAQSASARQVGAGEERMQPRPQLPAFGSMRVRTQRIRSYEAIPTTSSSKVTSKQPSSPHFDLAFQDAHRTASQGHGYSSRELLDGLQVFFPLTSVGPKPLRRIEKSRGGRSQPPMQGIPADETDHSGVDYPHTTEAVNDRIYNEKLYAWQKSRPPTPSSVSSSSVRGRNSRRFTSRYADSTDLDDDSINSDPLPDETPSSPSTRANDEWVSPSRTPELKRSGPTPRSGKRKKFAGLRKAFGLPLT